MNAVKSHLCILLRCASGGSRAGIYASAAYLIICLPQRCEEALYVRNSVNFLANKGDTAVESME